jgi:CDP-diglyceride synthetase
LIILKGLVFLLICLIGYLIAKREYTKLTDKEKKQFKEELKNPISLLFNGLEYIGFIIIFMAIIFDSHTLRFIGLFLVGVGLVVDDAKIWNNSLKKGLLLILLGATSLLLTVFFATRTFW